MRRKLLLGLSILAVASLVTAATAAAKPAATSFTTFELAATPPSATGTVCPGNSLCWNGAAEPSIRATPGGRFFASSENGLGSGTLAWTSGDNGLHYSSTPSPNDISTGSDSTGAEAGLEPGGGDTDVAVATAPNSSGNYNAYVASLTGLDVDVSTSHDKGASWQLNPVGGLPIDDREWAAATGASKVCVSYLSAAVFLLPEAGLHVSCSTDAGATFAQLSDAYDTSDAGNGCRLASRAGNLAFDPSNPNRLYAVAACGTVADALNPNPTELHVIVVAASMDGGQSFTDHVAYLDPDVTKGFDHNFPNLAVDRGGNVYALWSDNHNVYYAFSTDGAGTWSGPFQVSKTGTNIFPWATAGDAGKLDVVYYHTPFFDGTTPPDSYPVSAAWTVGFAQNLNATLAGSTFTEVTATPTVHLGGVCEGGVTCLGDNTQNRDLYDDFGVAAAPSTGFASIVYSDDQYTNDANDPARPGCDPTQNNAGSCDHTSIATQTSGQGIFAVRKKR
jgi:hypothetical protein